MISDLMLKKKKRTRLVVGCPDQIKTSHCTSAPGKFKPRYNFGFGNEMEFLLNLK